jgi:esterase
MLESFDQLEHLKAAAEVAGLEVPGFTLPEDHDVVVHRMRFHYLDWGAGGHPILFLHGGGLNAHTWDLVCLALRDKYHCVALDQRGHGDSEWSPVGDYSLPAQVRDIEGFIEKLGLKQPVVVGHSMGGFAAMAYAAKFARHMAGLVLVDVAPELNPSGTARIRNFLAQDRELDSVDAFVERAMAFNPLRNPALLRRSLLHNLRQLPSGKWTWKHDPNRGRPTAETMRARQEEIMKEVSHITCPTLVARGEHSDVLSDASAERFARALPKGRWVRVEGAAHTVQGDNPRALVA